MLHRKELAVGLVTLMYEDKADFTNTFRAMASVSTGDEPGTVPELLDQVRYVDMARNICCFQMFLIRLVRMTLTCREVP